MTVAGEGLRQAVAADAFIFLPSFLKSSFPSQSAVPLFQGPQTLEPEFTRDGGGGGAEKKPCGTPSCIWRGPHSL